MKNATRESFGEDVLARKGKVLVDFWAVWCGPCRAQAPILEEFAALHPEIETVKVDVDNEGELAAKYGVMSIPTLILFENGKQVKTAIGLHSLEELESIINS